MFLPFVRKVLAECIKLLSTHFANTFVDFPPWGVAGSDAEDVDVAVAVVRMDGKMLLLW